MFRLVTSLVSSPSHHSFNHLNPEQWSSQSPYEKACVGLQVLLNLGVGFCKYLNSDVIVVFLPLCSTIKDSF